MARKTRFGRGRWNLASCHVSLNSVQQFQRRSRKCLGQSEARAVILLFRLARKYNLVEDVEILLPVKFYWIPFSGFRGEVENVSANQRPGRSFCFSDRPERHKLGRGRWNLASSQVSLNSFKRFQRRSRKCEKLTTDGRTDNAFGSGALKVVVSFVKQFIPTPAIRDLKFVKCELDARIWVECGFCHFDVN